MENSDIIILTGIVSVLFLVFIISTVREFSKSARLPFQGGKEGGPRAQLVEMVGKLFSDEKLEPADKQAMISIIRKNIADIESGDQPH